MGEGLRPHVLHELVGESDLMLRHVVVQPLWPHPCPIGTFPAPHDPGISPATESTIGTSHRTNRRVSGLEVFDEWGSIVSERIVDSFTNSIYQEVGINPGAVGSIIVPKSYKLRRLLKRSPALRFRVQLSSTQEPFGNEPEDTG